MPGMQILQIIQKLFEETSRLRFREGDLFDEGPFVGVRADYVQVSVIFQRFHALQDVTVIPDGVHAKNFFFGIFRFTFRIGQHRLDETFDGDMFRFLFRRFDEQQRSVMCFDAGQYVPEVKFPPIRSPAVSRMASICAGIAGPGSSTATASSPRR